MQPFNQFSPLNALAHVQQQGEIGRERGQQNQLNQLASLSYGANTPEQRQQLLQNTATISRQAAQEQEKAFEYTDERRNLTMFNMAMLLTRAPEQARPGLYRQMVPTLSKFNLSELPLEYDAQSAPMINETAQALVEAYGGGAKAEQFTLGPGSKRFDAAGNVLAEVPFAPANGNIVSVPDGMGGKLDMVWDPRTRQLSPLPQAGAPGAGAAPMAAFATSNGSPYNLGTDLDPAQVATAQADAEANGTLSNVQLPDRTVGGPRLGYTPPEQQAAPAGFQWNGNGDALAPIPGGPQDKSSPAAAASDEQSLRKEVSQLLKQDQSILSMYRNVQSAAAQPSAAGDLSMIFAFMKMLDPGSVVREQEFANAQNAAGVPDQVRNAYNRAMSGQRLNPSQRGDFLRQARDLAGNAERGITATTRQYQDIAREYGYDPVRGTGMADFSGVTGTVSSAPTGNAAVPRPQSDAEFGALPSGTLYIDPDDGRTYRKR